MSKGRGWVCFVVGPDVKWARKGGGLGYLVLVCVLFGFGLLV